MGVYQIKVTSIFNSTVSLRIWLMLIVILFSRQGFASGSESPSQSDITNDSNHIAYIVSDLRIPFWNIMDRGVKSAARELGYEVKTYSAENSARKEMENLAEAIRDKVDGIVVSPTNSSACVTILKMANRAGIPVVISDIGTDGGEYVSYISSNNEDGSYKIGEVLVNRLQQLGWENGRVGIVAIPQKRANGQARTAGFMKALREAGIKGAGITQQVDFSYQETYDLSTKLFKDNPDIRAIWLQGSDRYQGALDAISDAGKNGEILLVTFDAEPEFLQLIPEGVLVGSAMQQPFLMGREAVIAMDAYMNGKTFSRNKQLPVLAISADNIDEKMPLIKRNVLGIESE